jgi:pyrimidine nucleoside transport protein
MELLKLCNAMFQIQWRPVLWGLGIQFVLGLITIRWSVGRSIFQCIGDKVATFLAYGDEGSRFVYGDFLIDNGVFVFKVCIQKKRAL